MTTHDGKTFTQEDLRGRWSLIYFGFTNCPDVCPDELDKMGSVVDSIGKFPLQSYQNLAGRFILKTESEYGPIMQPVFISCDPARDTPQQIRDYVQGDHSLQLLLSKPRAQWLLDFHPKLIGLTGTHEAVKACCKAYRVYFSTPPDAKPGDDYLVDHSIFFYLMDPNGEFVDAYGKSHSADVVRERVAESISAWKA